MTSRYIFGIFLFVIFSFLVFSLGGISALPVLNHNGTINTNEVWNNSYEHHIIDNVVFQRNLTIEPGAIIIFDGYYSLQIYNNLASLNASGNSTHPIIFTSNSSNPNKGDWRYLRFYRTVFPSYLYYINVTYGNQAITFSNDSGPVVIENSIFNQNNFSVYSHDSSKNKLLRNLTINNSDVAIDLSGTSSNNWYIEDINLFNSGQFYIHSFDGTNISMNRINIFNSTGVGFYLQNANNLQIDNISIINNKYDNGIWIRESNSNNLSNIYLTGITNDSIYIQNSRYAKVTNISMENSGGGIIHVNSNYSNFSNVIIKNTTLEGFNLLTSNNNSFSNFTIFDIKGTRAIWVRNSCSDNSFTGITIYNCSSNYLFYLSNSNRTNVTNFEMWGSGPLGTTYDNMVAFYISYTNHSIFQNGITRNLYNSGVGGDGFVFLDGSNYNLAENITSFENIGDGMQMVDGSDVNNVTNNIIRNSISYNNYQTGLEFRRVLNNTVINVTVFNNGRGTFDTPAGFDLREYSSGNVFINSTSYNNGEKGGLFLGENGVQNNTFIDVDFSQNDINVWGDSSESLNNLFFNCKFNGSRIIFENDSSYFIAKWSVVDYLSNISIRYGNAGNQNISFIRANFNNLTKLLNVWISGSGINKTVNVNYNGTLSFIARDNSKTFLEVSNGNILSENLNYFVDYNSTLYNFNIPQMSGIHLINIGNFKANGESCSFAYECLGSHCNSGVCSSSPPVSSPTTGSSDFLYINSQQIQNGYSRIFIKNLPIKFEVNNESVVAKINSVNNDSVVVSLKNENYSLNVNETKKIDLNNDGIYDLQINLKKIGISNISAEMEFKLINEEIPSETEKEKDENIVDEKISFWNKLGEFFRKIWDWVIWWK